MRHSVGLSCWLLFGLVCLMVWPPLARVAVAGIVWSLRGWLKAAGRHAQVDGTASGDERGDT